MKTNRDEQWELFKMFAEAAVNAPHPLDWEAIAKAAVKAHAAFAVAAGSSMGERVDLMRAAIQKAGDRLRGKLDTDSQRALDLIMKALEASA